MFASTAVAKQLINNVREHDRQIMMSSDVRLRRMMIMMMMMTMAIIR